MDSPWTNFVYQTGLTIQSAPSPRTTRPAFSIVNCAALSSDSRARVARCGVTTTFGMVGKGLSDSIGSISVTSRPAAKISFDSSALIRAFSSTTGPRHVLIRIAVGFIISNSASDIM